MSKGKKITELDELRFAKESDLIPVARESEPNGDNSLTIGKIISYNDETHTLTILGRISVDISPLLRCLLTVEAQNGAVKIGDEYITSKSYPYGTTLNLEAQSDPGYQFVKWQVNSEDSLQTGILQYIIEEDITIKAVFEEITSFQISARVADGQGDRGEAKVIVGDNEYSSKDIDKGSIYGVVARENKGYEFLKWLINGEGEDTEANLQNISAQESANFIAYFDYVNIQVRVIINDTSLGTITFNGTTGTQVVKNHVHINDTLTLVANLKTKAKFVRWEIPLIEVNLGGQETLNYQVVDYPTSKKIDIQAVVEHDGPYDFYYGVYEKPLSGNIADNITSFDNMEHADFEDLTKFTFDEYGSFKAVQQAIGINQVYVIFYDNTKYEKEAYMNPNQIAYDIGNYFSNIDYYHIGTKNINNKTYAFIEMVLECDVNGKSFAVGFSSIQ